jgi:hypothetical protein
VIIPVTLSTPPEDSPSAAETARPESCPQLRALAIFGNKAGPAGVAALGEALRAGTCPQLRTLNIRASGATKADLGLGELSAACPQLEVKAIPGDFATLGDTCGGCEAAARFSGTTKQSRAITRYLPA